MIRWFTLCLALIVCSSAQAQKKRYWMADFARLAQYSNVTISPNGRYIAAISPVMNKNGKSHRNLAVVDIDQPEKSRLLTAFDSKDLSQYQWVSNDALVFFVDDPDDVEESNALFRIDRETAVIRTLTAMKIESAQKSTLNFLINRVFILNRLISDPDHILITMDDQKNRTPNVYMINLGSGASELVLRNPGHVSHWHTDQHGKVRIAYSETADSMQISRVLDDGSLAPVLTAPRDGSLLRFRGFDINSGQWFIQTHGGLKGLPKTDVASILRFDPVTGVFGEVLIEGNKFDVSEFERNLSTSHLMAVGYVSDTLQWKGTNPKYDRLLRSLQAVNPDHSLRVVSASDDQSRMVVWYYNETDPGEYFLYVPAEKRLEALFGSRPWIFPEDMARSQPFKFETSDKLTIRGYLTLPGNDKNAPLVVVPHDGTDGRDSSDSFDPLIQFLAHQGFAVLRVNYRGSSGFGLQYWRSGWGQWGLKIQDDINEAVNWLATQSLADTNRVCIFGQGYGGLIAMIGVTRDPALYRCAITYGGISDLIRHLDSGSDFWGERITEDRYRRVGHPRDDAEHLRAISPVTQIDRLQAPVLIIHGRRDTEVFADQASRLRHAMRRARKPFEWVVRNDEAHEFSIEQNRFELFETMSSFLSKHFEDQTVANNP